MSPLSTVRSTDSLKESLIGTDFKKVQALIDMVECAIMCINIIMGIN